MHFSSFIYNSLCFPSPFIPNSYDVIVTFFLSFLKLSFAFILKTSFAVNLFFPFLCNKLFLFFFFYYS
ncbi:hypothetical protein CW304_25845 [Bacillus sp. UFRGS-B20]|nr:hypothetical protein CW304_25845 [Bacillus sp. UFRGS-B20]